MTKQVINADSVSGGKDKINLQNCRAKKCGETMTKVTITTSMELQENQKDKLEKSLIEKYGDIIVDYHIDENILGGIIIFDGNKIYDGSIRYRLNNLKEKINRV